MEAHTDYRAIFMTLKEVMKAKGLTYARLARKIGTSEVTMKRVFSLGQSCTLDRLFKICDAIGVSFFDIVALAKQEDEVNYFLTSEQENHFASKPAHFAILKELIRGLTAEQIKKTWELEDSRYFKILRSLERLGLVDLLPENKVRIKVRGNIRMAHRGPLAKKILRPQINDFLDHIDVNIDNKDVCMHSAETELSEVHIKEFVTEIHALGAKYRARAFRDRNLLSPKKLKSVRWLFGFAPFQTDWRQWQDR